MKLQSLCQISKFLKWFQKTKLGKRSLGEVLGGPVRDADDPLADDEDAALKALAMKFEQKYVSTLVNTYFSVPTFI